jgi:hypothetical protein
MSYRECIKTEIPGQYPVRAEQRGQNGLFRVTYGAQIKDGLTYAAAAKEYGQCVFHALACNGSLGNQGD